MRRALSAALACALAIVVAPVAARAEAGGDMAYDWVRAVAEDRERSQIFVAGSKNGDQAVTVTDFAGNVTARVAVGGESSDVAYDAGHDTAHVALPGTGEIVHVAAATRTVVGRTTVVDEEGCGLAVEMAGGRLWAFAQCSYGGELTGFTVGADGIPTARVTVPVGTAYTPALAGLESARYLLVQLGWWDDSSLAVVDTAPETPVVVARSGEGTFPGRVGQKPTVGGMALAPSGDEVHVVVGWPYHVQTLRLPDLAPGQRYDDADITYPKGISVSPDGRRLAVTQMGWYDNNLAVYAVGEPAAVGWDDWYETMTPGVWVSDDRLLVPSRPSQFAAYAMQVVSGLGALPARVGAAAAATGGAVRVTGRLRLPDGTAPGGRPLRVWRSHAGRPTTELPPLTTDAAGGFALDDTPPHPGRWRYRVTWPGDGVRAPAVAMATVTVAGTPPPLPPAPVPAYTERRVKLPVGSHVEIVADPANHRVYVAAGVLLVTDVDGGNVRSVPGVSATGIALSADRTTLYAAAGGGAIHAVDLATAQLVATWPTRPWARIATFVGEAGGRVWFGHQNPATTGAGWGVLDPGDPGSPRVMLRVGGPSYSPVFTSSPDGTLTGGALGQSPGYVYRWDVTGPEPVTIAARGHFPMLGSNLVDLEATPDGRHVLAALGSEAAIQLLDATTLATVRRYETGPYPVATAVSDDNRLHAAGASAVFEHQPGLHVHDALTGATLNEFRFRNLAARGLAFDAAGTRLYAIDTDRYEENTWLNVLPYPGLPRGCLVVDPTPDAVPVGSPLRFSGIAHQPDGTAAAGSTVRLVRQDDQTTLATAVVGAAGGWSLSTAHGAVGFLGYELRRDGCDPVRRGVSFVRRITKLAVGTVHATGRTALVPVTLTGHLGAGSVDVWRRTNGVRHYVGRYAAWSGLPVAVRVPVPSTVEARFAQTDTALASTGTGAALRPRRTMTWR